MDCPGTKIGEITILFTKVPYRLVEFRSMNQDWTSSNEKVDANYELI
jgi:hypothetical protein